MNRHMIIKTNLINILRKIVFRSFFFFKKAILILNSDKRTIIKSQGEKQPL